jgi:DNA-binding NtrC family response regulator
MKDMCRILFIDPDPKYLSFAINALKRIGISAVGFTGIKRAQQFLKSTRGTQLILIDLEFTEREPEQIRKLAELDRTHVVVLFPVQLTPHKMSLVFKLGAYDCVDKPYDKNQLIKQFEILIKETCAVTIYPGSTTTPNYVHIT